MKQYTEKWWHCSMLYVLGTLFAGLAFQGSWQILWFSVHAIICYLGYWKLLFEVKEEYRNDKEVDKNK